MALKNVPPLAKKDNGNQKMGTQDKRPFREIFYGGRFPPLRD